MAPVWRLVFATVAGSGAIGEEITTSRSSYAMTRNRPRTTSRSSPGFNRKSGFDGLP